jgi:hypothetical protein
MHQIQALGLDFSISLTNQSYQRILGVDFTPSTLFQLAYQNVEAGLGASFFHYPKSNCWCKPSKKPNNIGLI